MPDAAPAAPITIAAPAEYTANGPADPRWVLRVLPKKRDCRQADANVIVVCAPEDQERYRYQDTGPPPPTMMDDIGQALRLKLGAAEARPTLIGGIDGSVAIAVTIRMRF